MGTGLEIALFAAGATATAYAADQQADAASQVADASANASAAAKDLGQQQLDEARRQYDQNWSVMQPLVQAQTDIMREQLAQGRDAYAYAKTFRPLEQDMLAVASDWRGQAAKAEQERMGIRDVYLADAQELRDRRNWFDEKSMEGLELLTGGNSAIVGKYGADIENDVNTAVADARAGQSQVMNSAIRQAMRYGLSVPGAMQQTGLQAAQQIASAANNTRNNSIANYRNLVAQGLQQRDQLFRTSAAATSEMMGKTESAVTNMRNQRIQDEGILWGRGMDMAGLGRGMVGASQGAYQLASQAGSAAAQTQMAPGAQYLQGMNLGTQTMLAGQQMAMNGINAAAGYKADVASGLASGMGSLAGGIARYYGMKGQ